MRATRKPTRVDHQIAGDPGDATFANLAGQRRQRVGGATVEEVVIPGRIAARLDDQVAPEYTGVEVDATRGRHAGEPAVLRAEMVEGRGDRHDFENRRRHEAPIGVQFVDHLHLSPNQPAHGEVATIRAVVDRRRWLRAGLSQRRQGHQRHRDADREDWTYPLHGDGLHEPGAGEKR